MTLLNEPATQFAAPSRWVTLAHELAPTFAARAAAHDADESFVADNYIDLKDHGIFAAGVPANLGGGGASFAELCALLRVLGQACGSTALALSMHTHLVAGLVWRLGRGEPVEGVLRRIAAESLVLVSTGASDWLESSGSSEAVAGGYRVSGRKIFGSGSPAGDLLMTSFRFDDPRDGRLALHAAIPLRAPGVTILDTWRTLGMRGTASNDILLQDVFVPESAVSLRRTRGVWHPFFTMVANVALPLVMSVYVGIGEAAAERARRVAGKKTPDPVLLMLLGELENHLTTAQLAVDSMVALSGSYDFPVTAAAASAQFNRKTIATQACLASVEKAMEIVGGASFYRALDLERLLRDVQAAQFHPMQHKRQLLMSGRVALGLDPVG